MPERRRRRGGRGVLPYDRGAISPGRGWRRQRGLGAEPAEEPSEQEHDDHRRHGIPDALVDPVHDALPARPHVAGDYSSRPAGVDATRPWPGPSPNRFPCAQESYVSERSDCKRRLLLCRMCSLVGAKVVTTALSDKEMLLHISLAFFRK